MLYEFAIEPAVLAGWDKCRNTLNLMGFRHGRAIAAFPSRRNWASLVLEACKRAGCGGRELLRITEKLASDTVRKKFLASSRPYDDSLLPEEERWLRNALAQQASANPFHAILATVNPTARPDVVIEDDIDECHPLLNVPRETPVLREAAALAKHIRAMVRDSKVLLLIDPHFEPGLDLWWPVIKACLSEAACTGQKFDRIEIHTLESDRKWAIAEFIKRCQRNAVALVPRLLTGVRVVRWRLRNSGPDDFHERYVLTDRGGYKLGKGLDEETGKTQPVGLLDDVEWQRVWDSYQDSTAPFDKDGEVVLT